MYITPGCRHLLDPQLALLTSVLLSRLRVKDMHARHCEQRLFTGTYDVKNLLLMHPEAIRVIFISYDMGLDKKPLADRALMIQHLATRSGVPVVYALRGRDMALATGLHHDISAIAVLNTDGEEELLGAVLQRASSMCTAFVETLETLRRETLLKETCKTLHQTLCV